MNILVCDDAAFMRMMLKDMIEKSGHIVVGEASDGEEAISQYNNLRPDLVTMDITMPNKNGIEAVKGIIALNPKAKIIMCSAMGQQEMVIEAIRAGAKDFLVKPFNIERISEAIQKHAS